MINIDREFQTADISCDRCPHSEQHQETDFYEVIKEMKSDGWKIRRIDEEWEHICPDCTRSL